MHLSCTEKEELRDGMEDKELRRDGLGVSGCCTRPAAEKLSPLAFVLKLSRRASGGRPANGVWGHLDVPLLA